MKRVLDDLQVFCTVVEEGSLKKASERLDIPHSTVSRRIEALENNLGLVLLHRTTREVKVSVRGEELYQNCASLLDNINQSIGFAVDSEIEFKGKLSVSMPVRAGIDFLGAWLIDFAAEHPELQLDISLSNSNKHLIKDEIDLAFRVGPLVDSSAIALRLWDIPYVVCAHRSYVERHSLSEGPISTEKLESLPAVITRPATQWRFIDNKQNELTITPYQGLIVDDLGLAYHAAMTGQYIAMLPSSMVQDENMVFLSIESLQPRKRDMYAYYLGRRHAQSQIKHIVNYIRERYQQSLPTSRS
ncbi:LysR family transcriptional regulator [Photobacterium sp. BZF1]|uniref:LysR family transcriptional regulator n=1 Tax=Photobacterium sp. BZF1 TaxID=1904457 RepID=UPI0016535C4D|nr:LysR family transcriptional regulator [Photobacterium sp. BZF1]MBC7003178.1 LysR family transcriptional regulator [Photobacterium sp. BZF1]